MDDTREVAGVDIDALDGHGAIWSYGGEQLNATLLRWAPGHVVEEHVNDERDVLVVGIDGAGEVVIDEDVRPLGPGIVVVVPRGARRALRASTGGVTYLTAHLARGPLQVTRGGSTDGAVPSAG